MLQADFVISKEFFYFSIKYHQVNIKSPGYILDINQQR